MLKKYEWNIEDIQDTMKGPNLWIMGVEQGQVIKLRALMTYSID
jgi:hypothetical protein